MDAVAREDATGHRNERRLPIAPEKQELQAYISDCRARLAEAARATVFLEEDISRARTLGYRIEREEVFAEQLKSALRWLSREMRTNATGMLARLEGAHRQDRERSQPAYANAVDLETIDPVLEEAIDAWQREAESEAHAWYPYTCSSTDSEADTS